MDDLGLPVRSSGDHGATLLRRGFILDAQEVRQAVADRPNFVELTAADGSAIVPESRCVILSHILVLSAERLDEFFEKGCDCSASSSVRGGDG